MDVMRPFLHIVVIGSGFSELRPGLAVQRIKHIRKRDAGELVVTTDSSARLRSANAK